MSPVAPLSGSGRFTAVIRSGCDGRSRGIRVSAAVNGLNVTRVGLASPGMPDAVTRNRVRRRVRAALRPMLVDLTGLDLVVTAGAESLGLRFTDLSASLAEALGRARGRARARSARPAGHNDSHDTAPAAPGREPTPEMPLPE